ncbi:MAG TPA: BamA/TamA family outer membrane protein [Candidatus Sphingobacterium stercoripullorum]|uniref:BamA/TamA family outer membrane protein n=1 Tax=Candidatus Sphingobacterium stercoripullorum TaxID=2838759 RepID=A0A9D1W709_9SPHI|nr:BamA/TamA family outer membrane protein [Candidatus Sphingobacterium stercoripullorum]
MINKRPTIIGAIIVFLLLFLASCRTAKYLEDDQALVVRSEVQEVPAELKESSGSYISNEIRPNSRLNLFIYNFFNTRSGKYKPLQSRRNVGEPPRLLDSSAVDWSSRQIQSFLQNKGYFNAQVTPKVEVNNKRAKIYFQAELQEAYQVGEVQREIQDDALNRLYKEQVMPQSTISKGKQYDVSDLIQERERAYQVFRNHGYYDYFRPYMRVGVDTTNYPEQADLLIQIENPKEQVGHTRYLVDSVYLHIKTANDSSRPLEEEPWEQHDGFMFHDQTGKFKAGPIGRYLFVKSGDAYNLNLENLSYDRLYEMNGFRSVKVDYEKVDSGRLFMHYELIPRSVMGNQIEGEYTFSSGLSGFNVANTFTHRNIFGGSENLEIKVGYGLLFDPRLGGKLSQRVFNNDIQLGVNLVVPRLMVPFRTRSVGKFGLPRTTFSSSLQLFTQQQTYTNRYVVNTLNYTWYESTHKMHSFTPIMAEYRFGRLDDDFANQLIEDGYLLYVTSNNREYFGLGAQYTYTYNSPKLFTNDRFNYFRGMVELSGNLLSAMSEVFNFKSNAQGERQLFNVPYLQYAKVEADYRKYIPLGGNKQLVFRFNSGVAVPYGNNSSLLIFEKSFFAGGMNGIRAWQARTLGPGGYNRDVLPENLRLNLRNLDQLGELKLEVNSEYRFRLLNNFWGAKLNGATFIDVGNIWRIEENELNPDGHFRLDRLYDHLAIGTGFGLRIDMNYFVIRLDAGLKVKDPQFSGSKQWVIKELFNSREFKREFYQTHQPDRYGFIQYNFGVGLPF